MRLSTVALLGLGVAIALGLFLHHRFPSHSDAYSEGSGVSGSDWDLTDVQQVASSRCDIERRSMWSLTREAFQDTYLEQKPVIVVIDVDAERERHEAFQALTTRAALLQRFGNFSVTLSSANRNSYAKRSVFLHHYLSRQGGEAYMAPQPYDRRGENSWYFFGDQRAEEWGLLFDLYPSLKQYTFGKYTSLSFGIGPAGSGVPFHTHGHVFNEVLHGRKRWWLQRPNRRDETQRDPDDGPTQDPQASSLQWLRDVRPTFSEEEEKALLECTVGPGEVLYIPSQWHHATLNIGETVFMAAFV